MQALGLCLSSGLAMLCPLFFTAKCRFTKDMDTRDRLLANLSP